MKTTLKHLATVTLIVLLTLGYKTQAKGTETKDSTGGYIETTVQFENLTADETVLNSAISFVEVIQETETVMELENWMTSAETWNRNISCIDETEATLELEGWMFACRGKNRSIKDKDEVLTIESWMFDSNLWK